MQNTPRNLVHLLHDQPLPSHGAASNGLEGSLFHRTTCANRLRTRSCVPLSASGGDSAVLSCVLASLVPPLEGVRGSRCASVGVPHGLLRVQLTVCMSEWVSVSLRFLATAFGRWRARVQELLVHRGAVTLAVLHRRRRAYAHAVSVVEWLC